MQFGNEYEMTRKRYDLWTVPKMYYLPIFWVYVVIFAVSLFAFHYFNTIHAEQRWRTLAAFMMFISVYRGIFFKWMQTDKQYRLVKQNALKDKPWMCKIEVNDSGVKISANGTGKTHVKWCNITAFEEGKGFYDLKTMTEHGEDKARLDKDCFTRGDSESFKAYMLSEHADVPFKHVDAKWDRGPIYKK